MASHEVRSEVNARVWQIATQENDQVGADDPVLVLESMKMEIAVTAPIAGVVTELLVKPEDVVEEGQLLVVIEG